MPKRMLTIGIIGLLVLTFFSLPGSVKVTPDCNKDYPEAEMEINFALNDALNTSINRKLDENLRDMVMQYINGNLLGNETVSVLIELKEQPLHSISTEVKKEYEPVFLALKHKLQPILEKTNPRRYATKEEFLENPSSVIERINLSLTAEEKKAWKETLEETDRTQDDMRREILNKTGEIIIKIQDQVSRDIEIHGGTVTYVGRILNLIGTDITLADVLRLINYPQIIQISIQPRPKPNLDISVPSIYTPTWWSEGVDGGNGVWEVGILDSGIDVSHPALLGHNTVEADFTGSGTTDDDTGHGTHIAGIIASTDSTYKGVAYGVDTLINAKCYISGQQTALPFLNGTEWAINQGADILSLSYSFGENINLDGNSLITRFFDAVVDDIGIPVINSCDNAGPDPQTMGKPGDGFNIISTGMMNDQGTTNRGDDTINSASGRGPTADSRIKPDLIAPGTNIKSCNDNWEGVGFDFVNNDGCSVACPHISGAILLLRDYSISLTPEESKAWLINTADDWGTSNPDNTYGWGYINLNEAWYNRDNILTGTVDDDVPNYIFYRGQTNIDEQATLVWNRHLNYIGADYPIDPGYTINDLNLYGYSEPTNSLLDFSLSPINNIEQLQFTQDTIWTVFKVKAQGTFNGVTQENFALATEQVISLKNGPSFNININNVNSVNPSETFNVNVTVSNVGDLDAHGVEVSLNLPPGFSIISGANPQNLGKVEDLTFKDAFWTVMASSTPGNYDIWSSVLSSSYGEMFTESDYNLIQVNDPSNNPPNQPSQPDGPGSGETGTLYWYNTSTTDPDGDNITYGWDWDDGTPIEWTPYYFSGETCSRSHTWTTPGTYYVKVIAEDFPGAQSIWSDSKTVIISGGQRPPIRINSNADFDPAHGVSAGSGTEADPWIIENYDINGTNYGYCIYIGNTTDYFVVRNNYLHEASGVGSWPYLDSGLILYNVQSGTITTNNVSANNLYGIRLYSSSGNTIANNTVSNNGAGILLSSSSSNTITNNTASNNGHGIWLSSSNSNTITNNTALYNNNGIYLSASISNTITNNTMVDDGILILGDSLGHWNTHSIDTTNTVNGKPVYYWKNQTGSKVPSGAGQVILANCTNVVVENQNVSDGSVGISLGFSSNNTLSNNTANSNSRHGIYLDSSSSNSISNNNASSNNRDGINLIDSDDNTINNNNASNNAYSIYLYNSDGNTIDNNNASSNSVCGINLQDSSSNIISNNNVSSNYWRGIDLYSSNNNTITNNTANSHNNYGILLFYSNSNTISNNNASNNGISILLTDSDGNTMDNNTAHSNNWEGIYLSGFLSSGSDNNTISNNSVSSNSFGIRLSYLNSNNIIVNNTVSNNNVGISLADSVNNMIYHNNIIGNSNQASDDSLGNNSWDNGYPDGGNYWSDYVGVDNNNGPEQDILGSDGIGDTNYTIPGGSNVDNYPLMEPWGSLPKPSITVLKIVDKATAIPGDFLNYTIWFNNTGKANASFVWINDTLPADVTYVSDTSATSPTSAPYWASSGVSGQYLYFNFTDVTGGPHNFTITVKINTGVANGTVISNYVTCEYDPASMHTEDLVNTIIGDLIIRLPIRINSNADFDAAHGVTGGNGSKVDPWIIENYYINGSGYGYCIYIGNTTEYFVVRNNYLHDATWISSPYYLGAGLSLYNVQNGNIFNNTASSNRYGIFLRFSSSNAIANNTASNNNGGIYLWPSSNYNTLTNNIANLNGGRGISIYQSSNNTLINNTANSNTNIGISLSVSSNNNITHNTASNNDRGISLGSSSNYNTLTNNSANLNAGDGIFIQDSSNNILTNNTAYSNSLCGIILWRNSGSYLKNNSANSNSDGIYLYQSSNNTITNNTANLNAGRGITLYQSSNNPITSNTANSNGDSGIYLSSSSNNNITNNMVSWNTNTGIYLTGSTDNLIYHNNASLNSQHGIGLFSSSNSNTLTNNTANSNSMYGIYLFSSSNNTIANNIANSNTQQGIQILFNSNSNILTNNTANSNSLGINLASSSNSNTLTNNTANSNNQGILLSSSSNNNVINNTANSNTWNGICLSSSSNTNVINNIAKSNSQGIRVQSSSNNTITNNNASSNDVYGIHLYESSNNNVITNNIVSWNTNTGIYLTGSTGNLIYHNNIIGNSNQASDDSLGNNSWDNGYPSGGNYWGDYTGVDFNSTAAQNVPPPDGIGDTPYVIDANSQDNYPLMHPWGWVDDHPPTHSNEFPPISGYSPVLDPVISVHVTDISGVNASTIRLYVNSFSVFYDLTPIADGYNVSYWHEGGFSPNEVVTCRIKAEDNYGNLLDFTWEFTCPALFEIELIEGWNLISFPLIQFNNSITYVLSSTDGKWDYVQWYDSSDPSDHWKTYATYKPSYLNDLWTLNNKMGFWLHTTEACTLSVLGKIPVSTTIHLYAGWNLVGYPTLNSTMTVGEALWGTGADRVEVFDALAPYQISEVGPTYIMKPGEGYWIHVPTDSIWAVTNSIPPSNNLLSLECPPPEDVENVDKTKGNENVTEIISQSTIPTPSTTTLIDGSIAVAQGDEFQSGKSSGGFTLFAGLVAMFLSVVYLPLRRRRK